MSRAACLIYFFHVRPLTPQCDTELEREASRAAEASRVEVQNWREKAEGESHRLAPPFGLFSFVLNPFPPVLEQGEHLLTKGALAEAIKVAEALAWKKKAEGESC